MGYRLGVDLGTTFTAAATYDLGSGKPPSMLGLGNRALQIPSVLFLQEDGQFLIGEAAERKGSIDPARVVREFKRRMGDPVPLLVAGTPFSPQALTARLLAWVVAAATERLGSAPDEVVLTFPANWGEYKRDLLDQVFTMADVGPARTCPEPQAAAVQYAARAQLDPGARVVVYDLGGGTFDVCVLEKTGTGFTILGSPDGVEHLGGVDFDEAVFQHVVGSLGPAITDLDLTTPEAKVALTRLRRDCVEAKEALSADVDTVIPVTLPGRITSVRLTRSELENLIGPSMRDTVDATSRALRVAGVSSDELTAIVLVGGSSRIPLVSHLLQSTFGTATALDTHPKHDIALGAVLYAAPEAAVDQPAPVRRDGQAARDARALADARVLREVLPPIAQPDPSAADTQPIPSQAETQPIPAQAETQPIPSQAGTQSIPAQVDTQPVTAATLLGTGPAGAGPSGPDADQRNPWWRNRWLAIGLAAAAVLAVVVVGALALRDEPRDEAQQGPSTPAPSPGQSSGPSAPTSAPSSAPTSAPTRVVPGAPGIYGVAVSSDGRRIYASNSDLNTLSVVDVGSGKLAGRPIAVGNQPRGVGVQPDGTRSYVVAADPGTVTVIDTAAVAKEGRPIKVGRMPLAVAVHPTAARAYVTNTGSDSVSVIDTAASRTIATIPVGDSPLQVTLSPNRSRAYVANYQSNTVSVIDTTTNRIVGKPIAVPAKPHALAVSPDGSRLYVTHIDSNEVSVIDTSSGSVTASSITLPANAWDVAVSPDGRRLYGTLHDRNQVAVMDTSTLHPFAPPISVGKNPTDIAKSADGQHLYIANNKSGTISVISTSTNRVETTISVPK
ncbi:Hsp70 family protein [Kribbella sp. VKM Ac-2568]|uniref:Hsp70 family protein n=1 Tax=Kribbella sp. VKM Ac-2568 TaxID=2512219 RepID=UPI001046EF15|nr:Hsp70 family protein [Kribbella sp. VKM Ac-2568]TCM43713.1 YVTN family beta-propeller protein [Kribbella sp. VKM Ac-2568]